MHNPEHHLLTPYCLLPTEYYFVSTLTFSHFSLAFELWHLTFPFQSYSLPSCSWFVSVAFIRYLSFELIELIPPFHSSIIPFGFLS